jgi:mRNA interferase YafQ
MPKNIEKSNRFEKRLKNCLTRSKNYYNIKDYITVAELLVNNLPIPPKYRDHKLHGNLSEFRSLHIKPDWVLVYKSDSETVYFEDTGTHSDIYG